MTRTFMRCASDLGVVEDVLHVVQVLDHVEQLLHARGVVAGQLDGVLGAHRHLGHLGLQAGGFERGLHGLEVGRRGQHLDAAVVAGDHVLGAGLQRHFHHLVFAGAGRKDELPAVLELEGHAAFGAQVAAVLAEGVAHLGHGAHAVVGHAVDDDRRAADAVALVADLLVVTPSRLPVALSMLRLTVSAGRLTALAFSMASRRRGLAEGHRRPGAPRP
jgi:hypothetical protein